MKTSYMIAAAVGIVAGYFLSQKLIPNNPWRAAYAKGASFAA